MAPVRGLAIGMEKRRRQKWDRRLMFTKHDGTIRKRLHRGSDILEDRRP